jgi:hypothetical protein
MGTKERKTPVRRPVQSAGPTAGARHRPYAAKNQLEKPESVSRGLRKNFCWVFPRLIFGCCSCRLALQPRFRLADQAQQPAPFFDRQTLMFKQFLAMHNDPPFAFDQEPPNLIGCGRSTPFSRRWGSRSGLQFQHVLKRRSVSPTQIARSPSENARRSFAS